MTEDEKLYNTLNNAIKKLEQIRGNGYQDPLKKFYISFYAAKNKYAFRANVYIFKYNIKVFFYNFRLTLRRICCKLSLTKRIQRQRKSAKT